ncbi:hypothetical protein KC356_g5001 [Hortaea werneckii]|nr:hypothetical protein KC356_g5001 [Hortaea werneckii]
MDDLFQSTDVLTTRTQPTLETDTDSVLKVIMALRGLDISAESTFDFVLPQGCKEWPAPHYGPYSPHTEHPKPGGTLRLRKREATGLAKVGGKKAVKVQRQRRGGLFPMSQKVTSTTGDQRSCITSRESSTLSQPQIPIPNPQSLDVAPLTILSLPRELRDLIYSYLVLHPEPLIPQYRPCWKPTLPGDTTKRRVYHRVIRRLPPDPPLALVSRQLRHETLSAFYGANTFIFEPAAEPVLSENFNMLDSGWMDRWMRGCRRGVPSFSDGREAFTYLRNVELRFDDVRGPTETSLLTRMGTVTFSLSGGGQQGVSVRHDLPAAFPRACACREDAMVELIKARSSEGGFGFSGLGDVALHVCRWGKRDFGTEGKSRRVRLGQARRGEGARCERCGKVGVSRARVW